MLALWFPSLPCNTSQRKWFIVKSIKPQSRGFTGFCPESITFSDLRQRPSTTTPQTKLTIPIRWWYCIMGFQLKRTFCSKTFATGPSKLGSVVCQMENQTESRKNQGDHILQVQTRQNNRTQPKTVKRETKSLSSSEISRNYFWLPTHSPKTLWGHPGPLLHQVLPIKATS